MHFLWRWWSVMALNSVINIKLWSIKKNRLAMLYIFTNIYRSTFPVLHYNGICMFTTCSPILDRSLATVAELAFNYQLIMWFNIKEIYKNISIILIVIAEVCCWNGLMTGNPKWHVIEESLWCSNAIIFMLTENMLYSVNYNSRHISRKVLQSYILYMVIYDIPLYINREETVKSEVLSCTNISHDIDIWKGSLVWMTAYFTLGSWIAIFIA